MTDLPDLQIPNECVSSFDELIAVLAVSMQLVDTMVYREFPDKESNFQQAKADMRDLNTALKAVRAPTEDGPLLRDPLLSIFRSLVLVMRMAKKFSAGCTPSANIVHQEHALKQLEGALAMTEEVFGRHGYSIERSAS